MKRWPGNLALALASILLTLGAFEFVLRLVAPRYGYAADTEIRPDSFRIWTRKRDTVSTRVHPETGESHLVVHNNLGLRQHRDISPDKAAGEIRIGFFGDSFLENLRVPGPFQVSEVLDFLLNLHPGEFTVLNFGVSGYGTDQSYLTFRDAESARALDDVLYLFCANDLVNLYQNDLFRLDARGHLEQKLARQSPRWMQALSRLYLTYLAIDVKQRWTGAALDTPRPDPAPRSFQKRLRAARLERVKGDVTSRLTHAALTGRWSQLTESIALLRAILETWRREVEERGGRFHVVILPTPRKVDYRWLFQGYDAVDIGREFERAGIGRAWRFTNDGHWNELGNQLGAIRVFRYLEGVLGLAALDDESIEEQLFAYYASFPYSWKPTIRVSPAKLDAERSLRIRERYAGLESPERVGGRARAPRAGRQ